VTEVKEEKEDLLGNMIEDDSESRKREAKQERK